jgi:hypothetical protein
MRIPYGWKHIAQLPIAWMLIKCAFEWREYEANNKNRPLAENQRPHLDLPHTIACGGGRCVD